MSDAETEAYRSMRCIDCNSDPCKCKQEEKDDRYKKAVECRIEVLEDRIRGLKEEVFRLKMINSPDIDLKDQIQSLKQENKELINGIKGVMETCDGNSYEQNQIWHKLNKLIKQ